MIRVLIADDNAVIRHGLAALLSASADDIAVIGEAANGREAIERARELRPDVVLLDIRMPVLDGVAAAAQLSGEFRVLMLTYGREQAQVSGAIKAGALGYLVHGRFEPDELERAVRAVAAGETVLSPAVAPIVFDALRRGGEAAGSGAEAPYELTERELEVMQLVARGRSNGEIAGELVVSEKTVKNHVHNVYAKLGVSRRAEAIAKWLGTAGAALCLALAGAGCSDEREAPRRKFSKRQAIERIEAICAQMLARVEALGPEPPIRTGAEAELERFLGWQERAFTETERGLSEIERVPVPRDGSERYLRAYLRLARGVIDAQRDLTAAAKDKNNLAASSHQTRREANVKLAGQVVTRYRGKQIHEIHPVKFGGSPADPANKTALTPPEHHRFTEFWRRHQRYADGGG